MLTHFGKNKFDDINWNNFYLINQIFTATDAFLNFSFLFTQQR